MISAYSGGEAHLLNSVFKNSAFVFVSKGELQLGTWQSIMLAELDGPRERETRMEFLANGDFSGKAILYYG